MNLKMLMLRVGIDTQFGAIGPIFSDNTFEYVPIPEHPKLVSTTGSLRYSDIPARYGGGTIEKYLPPKLKGSYVHNDPEFVTYTYGDSTKNKAPQLLKLKAGDYILFYAGLRPFDYIPTKQDSGIRLYLIGYFIVEFIFEYDFYRPWPPITAPGTENNAHIRRRFGSTGLVIAKGSLNSKLLKYAIQISDRQQKLLLNNPFGLTGSIKRSGAGRWVKEHSIEDTLNLLQHICT